MRIIAGERRGHKFDGPTGREIRPTSDLVREALFNILRETVEGAEVLDLFAGTGALGLEALSRGASRALFVERDRENVGLIRRNLTTLRLADRGSVLAADAYRWVKSYEPFDQEPVVVFVDPPYRDYEERPARIRDLLGALRGRLPVASTIIVESGRPLTAEILGDVANWDLRRYGGTHVAIETIEPAAAAPAEPDGA
jgi:16S rRNA (guanine966-N2)-methyltransferase